MSVQEFANLLHDFGPAAANHLWQSTAFAAVAVALAFALRRNQARARYWIWMTASISRREKSMPTLGRSRSSMVAIARSTTRAKC